MNKNIYAEDNDVLGEGRGLTNNSRIKTGCTEIANAIQLG